MGYIFIHIDALNDAVQGAPARSSGWDYAAHGFGFSAIRIGPYVVVDAEEIWARMVYNAKRRMVV